jgi:hypothetical protein
MIYSEHSKKNHDTAYAIFMDFCQKYPSLEYRETDRWPNFSILYVEYGQETKNYIQVQLYPQTIKGSERPMFRINQGDAWYSRFMKEVETLWKDAQDIGSLKIGEEVRFGKYPQGAKGEVEPLYWRVLAVENGRVLLITKKLIFLR